MGYSYDKIQDVREEHITAVREALEDLRVTGDNFPNTKLRWAIDDFVETMTDDLDEIMIELKNHIIKKLKGEKTGCRIIINTYNPNNIITDICGKSNYLCEECKNA